jgi:hypothetical protein
MEFDNVDLNSAAVTESLASDLLGASVIGWNPIF